MKSMGLEFRVQDESMKKSRARSPSLRKAIRSRPSTLDLEAMARPVFSAGIDISATGGQVLDLIEKKRMHRLTDRDLLGYIQRYTDADERMAAACILRLKGMGCIIDALQRDSSGDLIITKIIVEWHPPVHRGLDVEPPETLMEPRIWLPPLLILLP